MNGPRMSDLPHDTYEPLRGLENVRRLEITYSRRHPGEGTCVVEYVGGRIELFEVDHFLLEQLLEHLNIHRGR